MNDCGFSHVHAQNQAFFCCIHISCTPKTVIDCILTPQVVLRKDASSHIFDSNDSAILKRDYHRQERSILWSYIPHNNEYHFIYV